MSTVAFWPYRLPLAVPYRWSKGVEHTRCGLIVRVELAGAVGWGEVAPPPEDRVPPEVLAALLTEAVTGLDWAADDCINIAEKRFQSSPYAPRLRCGLSAAVLSARARAAGRTLAEHLSTAPHAGRVPVNDLITDADPTACAERARMALARGQTTIKLKCTADRPLDLARAAAIRAVDAGLTLRLDPNESWDPAWALAHLEALAPLGIAYVEQPLWLSASLHDYSQLRARSPIPIALDHGVTSAAAVQRIVDAGAADVLILKAQRLGGPDRVVEVIELARRQGLACTVTASLETAVGLHVGLHCAAFAPAAAGLGTARYFAWDVATPPPIEAGHMGLPTAPGLGIDLPGPPRA